jgi:hypothetical protein
MNARFRTFVLFVVSTAVAALAADDTTSSAATREKLKAKLLEDAGKQATSPAAKPPDEPRRSPTGEDGQTKDSPASASATADKDAKPKDAVAKAKEEPATVLPKVEVNRSRLNEVDRQILEQEKEIAREKQNTKQTEADKALNNPKVSKALAIFGGESSAHRASNAQERVTLMEEERDLLEAIKLAKTSEEKAVLQKQIDELRAYRRQLEKNQR